MGALPEGCAKRSKTSTASAFMWRFIVFPEIMLAEETCPHVNWRSGLAACPILPAATTSGAVPSLKVDAPVQIMVCREFLGPGPGAMAAASSVRREC